MQGCNHASMALCSNVSIKVCMYASMYNVYIKYWANIQVSKFESKARVHVCQYASIWIYKFKSILVCMYESLQVGNFVCM